VALSINYEYHPAPPIGSFPPSHSTTSPLSEETILQPLKPESLDQTSKKARPPVDFYAGSLESDQLEIEIEIGPSIICLYGIILKILWDLKENYVGECRSFTDITEKPQISKRRLPFSRTTTLHSLIRQETNGNRLILVSFGHLTSNWCLRCTMSMEI